MNEAEDCAPIYLAQKAVIAGEAGAKLRYFLNEGLARFVVVMDMDFDICDAKTIALLYYARACGLMSRKAD